MATIVLQTVGSAIGGALGGPFGAALGRAAGGLAGYAIDQKIFGKDQLISGGRLENAQIQSSVEGTVIPKAYGRVKLAGQLIWATRFEEERRIETQQQGGKGGGPSVSTETFSYYGNFAVGICEGEISHIARIWADGEELDQTLYEIRQYMGSRSQTVDPLIEVKQGPQNTPAFRDTAFVVFDRFPLEDFGNRIPQFTFEIVRSIASVDHNIRAVCLIPGSTEYGYSPSEIKHSTSGVTQSENRHTLVASSDWKASLDELQALCPNLESVSLIVSWFGTDLRASDCRIEPRVVAHSSKKWSVSGIDRTQANIISKHDDNSAFGGTPDDTSVIAAIRDLKSRGLKVLFYPFIMMDIPENNTLPSPYNSNTQSAYPWRGRLTCNPAIGTPNSADQTALARLQIENFVGTATGSDFSVGTNEEVSYQGNEYSYRRHILHYAHLCEAAGGVDRFLIGSELKGLTSVRDETGSFPFVDALVDLAGDVRQVLRGSSELSYAADWSEYFGFHPQDGSNDLFYNLDKLWAAPAINAIAIDNYFPISDWHATGDPAYPELNSIYDLDYLKSNMLSGEGYDWFYANKLDRLNGARTSITDNAGDPWVWRNKDLISWWANSHFERKNGIKSTVSTSWQSGSKPIWFTEAGCPAVNRGTNQPNVFYDPKSVESNLPFASSAVRDDLIQIRYIEAIAEFWNPNLNSQLPNDMMSPSDIYYWAWDTRPFPAFPLNKTIWGDGNNWFTGHWLNGRLGTCPVDNLLQQIGLDFGQDNIFAKCDGHLQGYLISGGSSLRAAIDPIINAFNVTSVEVNANLVFCGKEYLQQVEIQLDDLVQEGDNVKFVRSRQSEITLPKQVELNHSELLPEYSPATTSSRRIETLSDRQVSIDLPAVVDRTIATGICDARLRDIWVARNDRGFSLPYKYLRASAGDLYSIVGESDLYQIHTIEDGTRRDIVSKGFEHFEDSRTKQDTKLKIAVSPDAIGPPFFALMNLPIGQDNLFPEPALYLATFADPWLKNYVLSSSSTTSGFEQRSVIHQQSAIYTLTAPLHQGPIGRWDWKSKVHLQGTSLALQSREQLSVFSGNGALAIETKDAGWEILQYLNAELVAQDQGVLSGLLRGQMGTEFEMMSGSVEGAKIVVLDSAIEKVKLQSQDVNQPLNWHLGSVYASQTTNMATTQVSCQWLNARPLSPVHLKVNNKTAELCLTWIRRSRVNSDNWDVETTPIGETSERYLVELFDQIGAPLTSGESQISQYTIPYTELANLGVVASDQITFQVSQLSESGMRSPPNKITVTNLPI